MRWTGSCTPASRAAPTNSVTTASTASRCVASPTSDNVARTTVLALRVWVGLRVNGEVGIYNCRRRGLHCGGWRNRRDSLSSLRSLPVDELKIDKSFIDNIATNADAAGVVHAILRLARTLQLDTVAEGVEHHDQLHELAALGCRHVQGFHFSKAVPAADAGALLRTPAPATRTP
jgi:hypothetical protein